MSCEIIYDKAFIKVESGIIPMICSGSSNCTEFTVTGREVLERNWFVLKQHSEHRNIFSVSEINKLADEYEKIVSESEGSIHKSRNKSFEKGEFKRWFLAGLKSAATIEEYCRSGNTLMFFCTGLHCKRKSFFRREAQRIVDQICGRQNHKNNVQRPSH